MCIRDRIRGDVPVYHSEHAAEQQASSGKASGGIGHQIYTQLMNGVSHMLPFVVGGGILIALAFLIDGLCVDMNALAPADRANFGTITPVAAMLKNIGGIAFGFMLPVLAGFIAMAIGDRPAPVSYTHLVRAVKEKLMILPEDTVVYPGHMGTTTIADEKRMNPFL